MADTPLFDKDGLFVPLEPSASPPAPEKPKRAAGTNPETGKPFTSNEVSALLTGDKTGSSMGQLFLAGIGADLSNRWKGLHGEALSPDEKAIQDQLFGTAPARVGSVVPSAVASMAAPNTIPAQMGVGFLTGATEPTDSWIERGTNALKAAGTAGLGQLAASTVVRGANSIAGNMTKEGAAAREAEKKGLTLTAGDIADSDLGRAVEHASIKSPSALQGEQVAKLMTDPAGDPITLAISRAHDAAKSKVAGVVDQIDAALAANPNLPKVSPRSTYGVIQEIYQKYPQTIRNIPNKDVLADVLAIAHYPGHMIPPGMTFTELNTLREKIGRVLPKIQKQATSDSPMADQEAANLWSKLYKSVSNDIDNWGGRSKASAEIVGLHNQMKDTFKNEVLPLRENSFSSKVLNGDFDGPERLLSAFNAPANKSLLKRIYSQLDPEGQRMFDALRLAQRGGQEFTSDQARNIKPLAIQAGLSTPLWLMPSATHMGVLPWLGAGYALEQGAVHAANTPVGKAIASGSPKLFDNKLADRAGYAALRGAARSSGLEALRDRAGLP